MNISALGLILIPVVVGLTQAIKLTGIPTRWIPLIAIFLGVLVAWLSHIGTGVNVLEGLVVGLSAAGLYSGTKTTVTPTV